MSRHIEMIDDYIVRQEGDDAPDYIYSDNHGVLIRCRDCAYLKNTTVYGRICPYCPKIELVLPSNDFYCGYAKPKGQSYD